MKYLIAAYVLFVLALVAVLIPVAFIADLLIPSGVVAWFERFYGYDDLDMDLGNRL